MVKFNSSLSWSLKLIFNFNWSLCSVSFSNFSFLLKLINTPVVLAFLLISRSLNIGLCNSSCSASMRSTFSVSKVDISFTRSVSDWLLIVSNGASKIDWTESTHARLSTSLTKFLINWIFSSLIIFCWLVMVVIRNSFVEYISNIFWYFFRSSSFSSIRVSDEASNLKSLELYPKKRNARINIAKVKYLFVSRIIF